MIYNLTYIRRKRATVIGGRKDPIAHERGLRRYGAAGVGFYVLANLMRYERNATDTRKWEIRTSPNSAAHNDAVAALLGYAHMCVRVCDGVCVSV